MSLPLATVSDETDTLMTERDDNADAPLHAEPTPTKAPRPGDVTTVPNKTLKIARSAWEAILLHDMKALRLELRILLEESLLRRPPPDYDYDFHRPTYDDDKWEMGLLRLMAVSIPRPQWDVLLHALLRRHDINRQPLDRDTLDCLWKAAQPDRTDLTLQEWRFLKSED